MVSLSHRTCEKGARIHGLDIVRNTLCSNSIPPEKLKIEEDVKTTYKMPSINHSIP